MERRGREDRVDRLVDGERLAEVRLNERDPVAEPLEAAAGLVEHRRRAVEGDDVAGRKALGEELRDPAAAAARVEDALVAAQLEALEDGRAPPRLGLGHGVVGPAVPVARCRHARRISAGIERPRPSGRGLDREVREGLRRPGPSA